MMGGWDDEAMKSDEAMKGDEAMNSDKKRWMDDEYLWLIRGEFKTIRV